ncbi:VerB [Colletotrichum scovillei]|uniref:VerB n=1 Tax=Colletotrichum scovillei TaxID=1209932 RepID=UPI0015C2EDC8|nr:VerB [Colletotrichum scovillei]KAF4772824.1 VerB [Colletotrichum scovillei]
MDLFVARLALINSRLTLASVGVAAAALLCLVGTAIYNLFFHPLRDYPGPLLWRMSSIPWCYHQITGRRTHIQAKLHLKYGDVVRVRPDELSYTSAQAWNDIYAHHPGRPEFPKDPRRQRRNPNKQSHILGANKQDHSRYRRLLSGAFSERGLRQQEKLIMGHVELLIDNLSKFASTGEKLDLTKWYNMVVFDVIGDLAWGESFHSLRNGRLHAWIPAISSTVKFAMQSSVFYEFGLDFLVPIFISKAVRKQRLANYKFSEEKVNERLRHGTDRGDFWDRILIKSSNDDNNDDDDTRAASEGMTHGEMLNNASIMVLAGSETSATTLCGMSYLLLSDPKAMQRLVQEIRSSFKSAEEITLLSVGQLPFLDAVFQETLRLYPPVPTHSQRVPPEGGASVSVGISMMGACLDHKNFYRASEFCPERWLKDTPLDFRMDNSSVYQPWSMGTRNCLGSNLARAEIRLIMAKVLWHFDLGLETDLMYGDWFDQNIWGVWFKKPIWVSLSHAEHVR